MSVSRARSSSPIYIPTPPAFLARRRRNPGSKSIRNEPGWYFAVIFSVFASPAFGFLAMRLRRAALFHALYAIFMLLLVALFRYLDYAALDEMTCWLIYGLTVNLSGTIHLFLHRGPAKRSDFWLMHILVAMFMAFATLAGAIVTLLTFPVSQIDGDGLAPTVSSGDLYAVRSFDPSSEALNRGDLVVFKSLGPDKTTIRRMARVIGLPGDTVGMFRGYPVLNGKPLTRRDIATCSVEAPTDKSKTCFVERLSSGETYSILKTDADGAGAYDNRPARLLPEGRYFVLSDNRDRMRDSRDQVNIGLPATDDILGFVIPLQITPAGRYKLQEWGETLSDSFERLRTRIFGARPPEKPQTVCGPWGRLSEKPWRKCTREPVKQE